jgi:hypothetical protein
VKRFKDFRFFAETQHRWRPSVSYIADSLQFPSDIGKNIFDDL